MDLRHSFPTNLTSRADETSRLLHDRQRDRQARNAVGAVQRARSSRNRNRAKNVDTLHVLRMVQAATCEQGGRGNRAGHILRYIALTIAALRTAS